MKYLFVFLCALLMGQTQLRAQYGGPLQIRKGSLVFFKISRELKAPAIYQVQVPFYVVGKVIAIKNSRVEINPQYYLYTCSKSSDEWIKTSKTVFEKQSFEQKILSTEILDASTHANYSEDLYCVRPLTNTALKELTRDRFIPLESCPKVIAINKYPTR